MMDEDILLLAKTQAKVIFTVRMRSSIARVFPFDLDSYLCVVLMSPQSTKQFSPQIQYLCMHKL